jgi:NADH:ubiquinone oxidoreductase subunit C
MGISFDGHPNMKRIFLWDGFQGYPLRKDFIIEVPGGGKATKQGENDA